MTLRILDRSLAEVGGKGLFVKELEEALAQDRADLAVHSAKDVPFALPEGFALCAFPAREDPRDALVAPGAMVSTRWCSRSQACAGSDSGIAGLPCSTQRAPRPGGPGSARP